MANVRVTLGLVLGLAAAAALSGCTGNAGNGTSDAAAVAAPAAPAKYDDSTGGIEGAVVNEEAVAVEGTQVAIPELNLETFADAAGGFSFSAVAPGTYMLFALKIGYEQATQPIAVSAGAKTEVTVQLVAIPVKEPYYVPLLQKGIFGCGLAWRPAVQYSAVAACGLIGLSEEAGIDTSQYDRFAMTWAINAPFDELTGFAGEMEWASTQAAGQALSFRVETPNCFNVPGKYVFASASGKSPIRGQTDAETVQKNLNESCVKTNDCKPDVCTLYSRVFPWRELLGDSAPADVGVTVQQQFTQHMTPFYNMPIPEDYTALAV